LNENVVNLQVVPGDPDPENVLGDSPQDMEITIVEDEDRVADLHGDDIPMDISMDVSTEEIIPSSESTQVKEVRFSKFD
jgi:hypothetical protein